MAESLKLMKYFAGRGSVLQEYNTKTASCHAIHYYQPHQHQHPHPHSLSHQHQQQQQQQHQRYRQPQKHHNSNIINSSSSSSLNSSGGGVGGSHKQAKQQKQRFGYTGHHSRHYKYDAIEECCRPIFHEHYGSFADML
ncbi:hypothetical protein KR093_003257 [Drosophila rubida]|uniref:Uncharacterized protein n=1 Tax=Drosophila rubida TaxID=30044 RepID=A0AAD4PRB0_9MUSC|nr:hypothetical protein KR093_003257 [Drosophila rubida]